MRSKVLLTLVAMASFVSVAQAVDVGYGLSTSLPPGSFDPGDVLPGDPETTDTYRHPEEDGGPENSVGLTAGGEVVMISTFATTSNNVITAVSAAFGSGAFPGGSGVSPGSTYRVFVWSDATGASPADATLVAQATCTAVAAQIDPPPTGNWVSVKCPISAVITTPFFAIGASVVHGAGTFPLALDQTAPSAVANAWVTGTSPPPYNPATVTGTIGLFQLSAIGLTGDWLLRANAIPEPATLALLALGGLAMIRRRR